MNTVVLTNSSDIARYFVARIRARIGDFSVVVERKGPDIPSAGRGPWGRQRLTRLWRGVGDLRLRRLERRLERGARRRHFPDFDHTIAGFSLPTLELNFRTAEAVEHLRQMQPDLFVVFGTTILPPEVFSLPTHGTINFHSALLPYYRGTRVEFWQLYSEDYEHTGATIHYVDEGADTGNIVAQEGTSHEAGDSFFDLRYKNILAGIRLIPLAVERAYAGCPGTPQGSVDQKTFTGRMITREKTRALYRRQGLL